jgi:DNA-binding NtrC family response regulator
LYDIETNSKRALLVDADEALGNVLQGVLGHQYILSQVSSVEDGSAHLEDQDVSVILLNMDLPGESCARLFWEASNRLAEIPVIAYSWSKDRKKALAALHDGAFDFIEQPFDVQALKFALDRAWRRAMVGRELADARRILRASPVEGLLGNSKAMEQVNEIIHKVAGVLTSVLLTGESGTGKGVVAHAIHHLSSRAKKPFVAFSASSFPETLMEDELFGHEKGAFTGASQSRRGRFEEANGGTVFLDEIGDLPVHLQTKLLRVLQERSVERLGANVAHPIDIRLICATNRNLENMVRDGTFREDLYFRISVVKIEMPPLRQRGEDIPLLAEYFLRMFAKAHNKRARGFTPGFLTALSRHSWPGNVRELQNVIERSLVLANGNEHLGVQDLPMELTTFAGPERDVPTNSFHEAVQSFKRELVRSALRMHSGNKLKAARELGISRCYLHRLLNQFKINGFDGASEYSDDVEPGMEDESISRAEETSVNRRIA